MLSLFGLAESVAGQTPTTVSIRLEDTLSSENSKPGDRFTAFLTEPLVVNGRIVASKDARVTGQVRDAASSEREKHPALLTLSLLSVQSASGHYPIATIDLTVKADAHAKRGALVRASAGTAGAYLTPKREIALPTETLLTFQVNSVKINAEALAPLEPAGRPTGQEAENTPATSGVEGQGDAPEGVWYLWRHRGEDDDADNNDQGEDHRRACECIFTVHDRALILEWFREKSSDLPPGLAKRDRLSPGLEKQLREQGTLPPGLLKRVQPLPDGLEGELHPLPRGYSRGIVGGNVIIVNAKTSFVFAILRGAI